MRTGRLHSGFSSRNFDIVMVMDAILISMACLLIILAYREITDAPIRHAREMAETVMQVSDDLSSEDAFSQLRLDSDGSHQLRRRVAAAKKQISRSAEHAEFTIFSTHPRFAPVSAKQDEFREAALAAIQRGEELFTITAVVEGVTIVRVAAPLLASSACADCREAGLPPFGRGDVIGIREIIVPVGDGYAKTVSKLLYACGMLAASLMVFLGVIIPMIKRHREQKAHMRDLADALELQASTDALTGLHNRRHFEHMLEALVKKFNDIKAPLGLLVLDLDHFKQINDNHGHDAGDMVLREVALRLKTMTREGDVVARIGGEEFAVIAPHASPEQLVIVAERYRNMIGSMALNVGDAVLRPTISIGLGCKGEAPASAADLFKAADTKLYEAKRQGRNRVAA